MTAPLLSTMFVFVGMEAGCSFADRRLLFGVVLFLGVLILLVVPTNKKNRRSKYSIQKPHCE